MVDLPFGRGVALALLLLGGCAQTSPPAALAPLPGQASNEQRRHMSEAIMSGDRVALTRAAIRLARMGGGMSDHGFDSFSAQLDPATLAADAPDLSPANRVEGLRSLFHENIESYLRLPEQVAEVPAEYRIVEGIAYDKATGRLFIGTVADGRLAYLHKGAWHEVPIGFPRGGLFGMAIDPRRRLLWIATGTVEETAVRDKPLSGLIAVDLDRLTVVERIKAAGESGVPGDVTIGRDGSVYMSDGKSGAVQILRPGMDALRMLVPPGRFKSPQGMALSGDQRTLYVADYSTGLWTVRVRDGQVMPMQVPKPMMLDGIDGLVKIPTENALIAVQNGTSPRRVIKLDLSPGGNRIDKVTVVEIVPPTAGDPSLMTRNQWRFWFVGDGQWERYGPGGVLKDGKPPRPTPILETEDPVIVIT